MPNQAKWTGVLIRKPEVNRGKFLCAQMLDYSHAFIARNGPTNFRDLFLSGPAACFAPAREFLPVPLNSGLAAPTAYATGTD